jgi:hypothetical protein
MGLNTKTEAALNKDLGGAAFASERIKLLGSPRSFHVNEANRG